MLRVRFRWHLLVIASVLALLSGASVLPTISASSGPSCADAAKTDEELLQIAVHELVPELREAAAKALIVRLQIQEGDEKPALGYLEELARSPSAELREKVLPLLTDAYLEALEQGQLALDGLIAEILRSETGELQRARAEATLKHLLRGVCPPAPEPELLGKIVRLLRGGEEELCGYRFDGSYTEIREAALAAALAHKADPSQLHSCEEWRAIAATGEIPELRWFAAAVYVYRYPCFAAFRDPQALLELAIADGSHELRLTAAFAYVTRHLGFDLEELLETATHEESEELRWAAAAFLTLAFLRLSEAKLLELATAGETVQVRWAAGGALGLRWGDRATQGTLASSDIPRQSRAEARSLEQALIIFAVENTVAQPELARVAIQPLAIIWSEGP